MHGHHHYIRVCGHSINWHKPIKSYVLVKFLMVTALISMPVSAAEVPRYTPPKQASHASAHPSAAPVAAEKSVTGQADMHDQRTAGSPSLSPAMLLAMALGLRTATGPMESTHETVSPSTKVVRIIDRIDGRDALARDVVMSRMLSKKENYSRVALE
jgi:hypothetical protein